MYIFDSRILGVVLAISGSLPCATAIAQQLDDRDLLLQKPAFSESIGVDASASAGESRSADDSVSAIVGRLLYDPVFEDDFIEAIRRRIDRARTGDEVGLTPFDLSIEGLRDNPDFDHALDRRIDDLVAEQFDEAYRFSGVVFTEDEGGDRDSDALNRTPAKPAGPARPAANALSWTIETTTPSTKSPTHFCFVNNVWRDSSTSRGAGATAPAALAMAKLVATADALNGQDDWIGWQVCPAKCPVKWATAPKPNVTTRRTIADKARDAIYAARAAFVPAPPRLTATGTWKAFAVVYCSG